MFTHRNRTLHNSQMNTLNFFDIQNFLPFLPARDAVSISCTSVYFRNANKLFLKALFEENCLHSTINALQHASNALMDRWSNTLPCVSFGNRSIRKSIKEIYASTSLGQPDQISIQETEATKLALMILADPRGLIKGRIPQWECHCFGQFLAASYLSPAYFGAAVKPQLHPAHASLLMVILSKIVPILGLQTVRFEQLYNQAVEHQPHFNERSSDYATSLSDDFIYKSAKVVFKQRDAAEHFCNYPANSKNDSKNEMEPCARFRALRNHPSVQFLCGWVCYKAGGTEHLVRAIKYFSAASVYPVLTRTCTVLSALCLFHLGRNRCPEMVVGALIRSLKVASQPLPHGRSDGVESSLVMLAQAALSIELMHMYVPFVTLTWISPQPHLDALRAHLQFDLTEISAYLQSFHQEDRTNEGEVEDDDEQFAETIVPLTAPRVDKDSSERLAFDSLSAVQRIWETAGVTSSVYHSVRLLACARAMLCPHSSDVWTGHGREYLRGEVSLDVPVHPYESCAALSLWGREHNSVFVRGRVRVVSRPDTCDDKTIRDAVHRGLRAMSICDENLTVPNGVIRAAASDSRRPRPCCHVCGKDSVRLTCQGCARVRYCSKRCLQIDWPTHESFCLRPLSTCRVCGKLTEMGCAACGKVYYCSMKCQTSDWERHKPRCLQVEASIDACAARFMRSVPRLGGL